MKARALKILAATKLLPLLLLLALPAVVQAQLSYPTSEGTIYYDYGTNGTIISVFIVDYSGSDTTLTIPDTINGYPVTNIGEDAFDHSSLTSVIIPDSVTNIGSGAFIGSTNLTSVTIGNGVTRIGDNAFDGCYNLTSVTIGNSVTRIGAFTFYNTSLTSVTIPDSVTYIGDGAFGGSYSLTSVVIGNGVTYIGGYAFEYDDSLTSIYFLGNPPIPNNDISVFYGDNTGTVYYQPGTTNWDTFFDGWPTMLLDTSADFTYTINDDSTITITGDNNISDDGVVIIPSTINGYPVSSIGDNAFFEIYGVNSVIIPNGVTSIGENAFFSTDLTSVNIPASVTSIGLGAFSACYSLTSITVDASNPDYSSLGGVLFDKAQVTLLQIPGSLGGSYTIPNSVTSIGDFALVNSYYLASLTVPASVTSIGLGAFSACYSLTNITVDASNPDYTSLGGVLFDKAQLTLVQFPGGLRGSYTIPNSVTNIGDEAFTGTSVGRVTIPNNVTSIGSYVFDGCYYLTSVTIGNGVTSIGFYAFSSCDSLTNITVAASNPDYSSLNGVLFDKAQLTLLQYPYGLGGSYTIPASVTNIGYGAFSYCTSLTNVTIPASVTSIGYGAFSYCTSLTGVYFQGNSPTPTNDTSVFSGDTHGVVYYLQGTTGWGTLFDGLPTMLLVSNSVPFSISGGSAGVGASGFGFTINGTNNQIVVVEASTNLTNWQPIQTNTLTGTSFNFSDPQWTNYPGRYYRLSSQ